MSIIETITDTDNTFLSRRELVCNFAGLAGKLQKLEAVDMVSKEFSLDGKVVIPIRLKTHVGKPLVTGTFYVYDDELLAKKHINPTIFSRLERSKAKAQEESAKEAESAEDKPAEDKPVEGKPAEDAKTETKEKSAEKEVKDKPAEEKSK